MSLRVVCDTNVLVSALIADGPPSRVLELVIDHRIELVLPSVVLDELERVLVDELGFDHEHVEQARRLLARLASSQPDVPRFVSVTGDREDDAILASAVAAGADALVTGDKKHLIPLEEHRGVRVVTPQALLAQLQTQS